MTIDMNKQYRTTDGRPVRLYAKDGRGVIGYNRAIHGAVWNDGWVANTWNHTGTCETPGWNLVEVTLADELTEQIPWEALRPEIQWVAMDANGEWWGFKTNPTKVSMGKGADGIWDSSKPEDGFDLRAFSMPDVTHSHWNETLCKRPEGR